jgi:hypothetical protein
MDEEIRGTAGTVGTCEAKDPERVRGSTFGEKAVGLDFSSPENEGVRSIKAQYAAIIDALNEIRRNAIKKGEPLSDTLTPLVSTAITEAQGAQMWAVKALTWKY